MSQQSTHSQDQTAHLHALGTGKLPTPQGGPSVALLEAFPNRFPHRPYVISISFPEFTSLCPVTGQPDMGTISVEYIPDELCVESKSFKLYMFAFRNHQSFMETITNTVLDDLNSLLSSLLDPRQGLVRAARGHPYPCLCRAVQGPARPARRARAGTGEGLEERTRSASPVARPAGADSAARPKPSGKAAFFSAKRQAVWFEAQSVSNGKCSKAC